MTLTTYSHLETTARRVARSRSNHLWQLRHCSIFREVNASGLESIGAEAKTVSFRKGDVLSDPSSTNALVAENTVRFVVAGQIKLCGRTPAGRDLMVDVLATGDAFGGFLEHPALLSSARPAISGPTTEEFEAPRLSAGLPEFAVRTVAMSDGVLMTFETERFKTILEERPMLMMNLSRFLGLRQRRLEVRLARLLYRTSAGKISGLLVDLAEHHGEPSEEAGTRINLRLTHQEIAALVGIKRETVSEVLAKLETEGLIRYSRRELVVLDAERLLRVA